MTNIHVDTSNITTLKLCCVRRCDDIVRNVWRTMFWNPTIFFYHRMLLITYMTRHSFITTITIYVAIYVDNNMWNVFSISTKLFYTRLYSPLWGYTLILVVLIFNNRCSIMIYNKLTHHLRVIPNLNCVGKFLFFIVFKEMWSCNFISKEITRRIISTLYFMLKMISKHLFRSLTWAFSHSCVGKKQIRIYKIEYLWLMNFDIYPYLMKYKHCFQ